MTGLATPHPIEPSSKASTSVTVIVTAPPIVGQERRNVRALQPLVGIRSPEPGLGGLGHMVVYPPSIPSGR
jgi:hypothetical protein